MSLNPTRRAFTSLAVSVFMFSTRSAWASSSSLWPGREDAATKAAQTSLAALEAGKGGRLGVFALNTMSHRQISYRAEERFSMCSTHKFLTVAAILERVDAGRLNLNQQVSYGQADILAYAPITRQHLKAGSMSVAALCAAAIEWSDNTAANLLLKLIGGPVGWTRYARSIGDNVSRLDRTEPTLNEATPGDMRDTTSPYAMARDIDAILRGQVLTTPSRQLLEGWMLDNQITNPLLRAGVPAGWRVADKSGSGDHGTRNDIGLILPPAPGGAIIAAVYYTESPQPASARDALIAKTGQIIASTLT